MPTDFTKEMCEKAMIATVERVFSTIMEAKVALGSGDWKAGPDAMTAVIDFKGDWRGAIALQCSTSEARHLAVMFLGKDEIDGPEEDSRDVMGELLNIIAGNLKPVLPRGAQATLPTVVSGPFTPFSREEAPFVIQTPFSVNKDMFWLTFTKQPGNSQAPAAETAENL
jgi:CheY-specific phosphatase CheX